MAAAGKHLEEIVEDLFAEVGTHAYTRNDFQPGLPEKMGKIISMLQGLKVTEFAGQPVQSLTRKDGTMLTFADESWLLLRPSGTEPVIRVYAEASTLDRARELVAAGSALIEKV